MHLSITITRFKTCTRCGKDKPLGAFQLNKASTDGHRTECRECNLFLRQRKRLFNKYEKHRAHTAMMSDEAFEIIYKDREIRDYVNNLSSTRSRGNRALQSDMRQAAWVRIAFLEDGSDIDKLKYTAERAIEAERWKHWAKWYHEGLSYAELMSHEEWDMWTTGCLD